VSANQRLDDHFRSKAAAALPDTTIQAVINGQAGMAPTLKVFGLAAVMLALGGVCVFGLHASVVATAIPLLVAIFGGAVAINFFGQGRLLVVTVDEIVVFDMHKGRMGPVLGRSPRHLNLVPYWDSTWLRLDLGPETVWVSKKLWEGTVTELAP
jgi:hypothetical protein